MPAYYSYIAKLDSPGFFWNDITESAFRLGNTPRPRIIPQAYGTLGYSPAFIDHLTKDGRFQGKQIDWGAWGVLLAKSDLQTLWQTNKDKHPWSKESWLEIWNQIETLDDRQTYILVVAEDA